MDTPKVPLVFSERVIRRLMTNQFSADVIALPKDYQVIKLVFRKRGGSWEGVAQGNFQQIHLLGNVVRVWGRLREKQRKVEVC